MDFPPAVLLALVLALAAAHITLAEGKSLAGRGWSIYTLQTDGTVFAQGNNEFGQLGTNSLASAVHTPVQMQGLTNAVDISAGWSHACVALSTGQAKCVGYNAQHSLGDNTIVDRSVLTPVSGLASGVAQVFCGSTLSCAVLTTGGARCWGDDSYGALGAGTKMEAPVPGIITNYGTSGVRLVAIGDFHTCILTTAGKALCSGLNSSGQLGDGTKTDRTKMTAIKGTYTFASLSAGDYHTCGVTSSAGAVFCWGSDDYGQLGNAKFVDSSSPVAVTKITTNGLLVWLGDSRSFVVLKDGTARAFGNNENGMLGNGLLADSNVAVTFASGQSGISEIRGGGGGSAVCVLLTSNEVKCLGSNDNGEMGAGEDVTSSLTLVSVRGLPSPVPVEAPTTKMPTAYPTTGFPTAKTTKAPTSKPSTGFPTKKPTKAPTTRAPANTPTKRPTKAPTSKPSTGFPTKKPTKAPTTKPVQVPTSWPTKKPTNAPTGFPTTGYPTKKPSKAPTSKPAARLR